MLRSAFHDLFNCPGPVVTPVIHVLDAGQIARNIEVAQEGGAAGVFLINHDFGVDPFLPLIRETRERFPALWMGVNFLGVTGRKAFPTLARLGAEGTRVDAYWADDARILERSDEQEEANAGADVLAACGWPGLYFGGTAFKKQRPVDPADYEDAARRATAFMDVVTTSGIATGEEADLRKIEDFRAGAGETAIALASGVTPENAVRYRDVDCFLVATGINKVDDFYNIDPARLAALMAVTKELGDNA